MGPMAHDTISHLPIASDKVRLSEDCKVRNFSPEVDSRTCKESDQEVTKTADNRCYAEAEANKHNPTRAHSTNTTKLAKHDRICSLWYHRGSCDKMSRTDGRACTYLHETVDGVELSRCPPWGHKKPCGLALCEWRDVAPQKRKRDEQRKSTVSPASPVSMRPSSTVSGLQQSGGTSKKRKRSSKSHPESPNARNSLKRFQVVRVGDKGTRYLGHRDDPRATNSSTIGYDDASPGEHEQICDATVASSPNETAKAQVRSDDQVQARTRVQYGEASPSKASDDTCFFWYHGRCARAEVEKNRFYCPHKHYLSNPPSMIEAPPAYVHKRPCYLAWCPGDGAEKVSKEDTDESFIIENEETPDEETDDIVNEDLQVASADVEQEEWFLTGFE